MLHAVQRDALIAKRAEVALLQANHSKLLKQREVQPTEDQELFIRLLEDRPVVRTSVTKADNWANRRGDF